MSGSSKCTVWKCPMPHVEECVRCQKCFCARHVSSYPGRVSNIPFIVCHLCHRPGAKFSLQRVKEIHLSSVVLVPQPNALHHVCVVCQTSIASDACGRGGYSWGKSKGVSAAVCRNCIENRYREVKAILPDPYILYARRREWSLRRPQGGW